MSIVTIYILYADDVRVLSTDKVRQYSNFNRMEILHFIILVLYALSYSLQNY